MLTSSLSARPLRKFLTLQSAAQGITSRHLWPWRSTSSRSPERATEVGFVSQKRHESISRAAGLSFQFRTTLVRRSDMRPHDRVALVSLFDAGSLGTGFRTQAANALPDGGLLPAGTTRAFGYQGR